MLIYCMYLNNIEIIYLLNKIRKNKQLPIITKKMNRNTKCSYSMLQNHTT